MSKYLRHDYFESQASFRELAAAAGGSLEQYDHPSAVGPGQQPLAVDIAIFGNPGAEKLFFNVNGVHGTEAHPGAAAQLRLIDSGRLSALKEDVCAVLIHNLNPWGWAHYCQRNEDGLDLNRNFVDFEQLPASDELHEDIQKAIATDSISLENLVRSLQQVMEVRESYGHERFDMALMVGQYRAENGLKFGGFTPAWSNGVLRDIATKYTANAEKIAYLDWHTGLGEYGETYELPFCSPGTEAWDKTIEMWGETAVVRGSGGLMSGGKGDDASVEDVNGAAIKAVLDATSGAEVAGGVVEFGTVPFDMIVQAVILDFWVMRASADRNLDLRFWKAMIRTMFSPRDPLWEANVLRHAEAINERMLSTLEAW